MKKLIKLFTLAILTFTTICVNADNFSLKNTKTAHVYGPFENERGTRFNIDGKNWSVMSARPGQILFADYPATTYYGPYDFKKGHIIKLGSEAFEIIDIVSDLVNDSATVDIVKEPIKQPIIKQQKPTQPSNTRVNIIQPTITQASTVAIADNPQLQKRELAPAPTTNPSAHKEPELFNFKMTHNPTPRSGHFWIEPINASKYNWKIGDFNGEKDSEIERKRIGVSGTYVGWFVELAYSLSGESTGKLVPDGSSLSDLMLGGGKGYMFRFGYNYRFNIDGYWNGYFKAMFEYAKEDYDLTATAFQEIHNTYTDIYDDEGNIIEYTDEDKPLASFGYVDTSSSITISEKTLTLGFGIDRTTDFWGVGFDLGFVAYSDLTSTGSVVVGQTEYNLDAKRSHPIICEFNGWFKPVDYLYIFGEFYLGSDTGLRLGVGKEF